MFLPESVNNLERIKLNGVFYFYYLRKTLNNSSKKVKNSLVKIFSVKSEVIALVILDTVRFFERFELRIGIEHEMGLQDLGQVLDPLHVIHDESVVQLDRLRIVRNSPGHRNVDLRREAVHLFVVVNDARRGVSKKIKEFNRLIDALNNVCP